MSASEQADQHVTYTTEQEEDAQAIITASRLKSYDVRPRIA